MLEDPSSLLSTLLRFGHIVFGIVWLGHLYFLNLVNVPLQGELEAELKPRINPRLLLRVLYWFRMGAMYTFVFGWILFGYKYGHQKLLIADGAITNRGWWILFGGLLGTVMWFNVWFIIWPRQKALLTGLIAGQMPADAAVMAKTAAKASRFNLFASGPLLFAMIVPNNDPGRSPWAILLAIVLGVGFWMGPLKRSFKIKTDGS